MSLKGERIYIILLKTIKHFDLVDLVSKRKTNRRELKGTASLCVLVSDAVFDISFLYFASYDGLTHDGRLHCRGLLC
jgi:hypothetical protein